MANESAGQVHLRNKIDPPCVRHKNTEAVFVCRKTECDGALACPRCIVEGGYHCGHSLTLLQDLMDSYKTNIAEFNTNTKEQVLSPLKKMSEKVAADLLAYEDNTSVLLKEIDKRGDQLHSQVDKMVNEHQQKCRQIRASNLEVLKQYQRDMMAKIAEVEEDITKLEACIQSTCKADIINAAKTGISKMYTSIDYPRDVDVSFDQSEIPLQDMRRFLGRIVIGNDQSEREETDEEKIKRMESEIQELRKSKKIDKARIQTSEAKIDGLTRELQDLKRNSEKRETEMQQKIKELESRIPCSGCGNLKEACKCKTCPKCAYKGNDFKYVPPPKLVTGFGSWEVRWQCQKCKHVFTTRH